MQQHKFALKVNDCIWRSENRQLLSLGLFLSSWIVLDILIMYRQLHTSKYLLLSVNWCDSAGSVVLDCKNFPISLHSESPKTSEKLDKGHILFQTLAECGPSMAGVKRRDKQSDAHWNATDMKLSLLVRAEAAIQNMYILQNCKGKLLWWLINEINWREVWFFGDQRNSAFDYVLLMLQQITFTWKQNREERNGRNYLPRTFLDCCDTLNLRQLLL